MYHRRTSRCTLGDNLVIDIGDVDDPLHLPAGIFEIAFDGVKDDWADHVPNVARLVDGRTAEIHSDVAGAYGNERFLLLAERVVDLDRRESSCGVTRRSLHGSLFIGHRHGYFPFGVWFF